MECALTMRGVSGLPYVVAVQWSVLTLRPAMSCTGKLGPFATKAACLKILGTYAVHHVPGKTKMCSLSYGQGVSALSCCTCQGCILNESWLILIHAGSVCLSALQQHVLLLELTCQCCTSPPSMIRARVLEACGATTCQASLAGQLHTLQSLCIDS